VKPVALAILPGPWIRYQKERKNLFVFFPFSSATIPSIQRILFDFFLNFFLKEGAKSQFLGGGDHRASSRTD